MERRRGGLINNTFHFFEFRRLYGQTLIKSVAFMRKILLIGISIHFLLGTAKAQQGERTKKVEHEMEAIAESQLNPPQDSLLHPAVKKGFIPVPIIVTEPALGGFGGGLAIGYLHTDRKSLRKNTPPIISGIAGGMTRNKTWFAGLGHAHSFANDHIRYSGGLMVSTININFYEELPIFGTIPIGVKMEAWGTRHKLMFRIKESNIFIGPSYAYIHTRNRLNENTDHPKLDSLINRIEGNSNLGMLGLQLLFDNRDNQLSPNEGIYAGAIYNYNATFFGGDENFGLLKMYSKFYVPVGKQVFANFRFDGQFAGNEVPFYAKPFIQLRGVSAARYQGNEVMVIETQWRWNFFKSLSILGFTGTGKALESFSDFGESDWIYNYGFGGRVALKKLFDIRMGVDAAWSNEDFAWYITVGSSF